MDRRPTPRAVQSAPAADAWRDRPVKRAYCASDLHLHGGDPAGVQRAVAFVHHVREQRADALFLLGDVFRAWMGPRSLRDPGLAPFLDALAQLAAGGTRVVLLHGNHDFLLDASVQAALGLQVAGTALDVALGGQCVRLLHGDVFCTRDIGYHRLHRVLRSWPFRTLVLALPLSASNALAKRIIDGSDHATAAKTRHEMDIVDEAVLEHLRTGIDAIVCGHVHYARDAQLSGADGTRGRLVVMADFERSGSHAVFADGRLRLVAHDPRFARPAAPVVAIDGPAGSGKSAVARLLAERLGWARLDSGALYRAVTARALAAGAAPGSPELAALVASLRLEAQPDGSVQLDGEPVPDALLRSPEVSEHVSPVSADPAVRAALLPVQRSLALRCAGLVAEGRDMASVVFPDAVRAIYIDARPEVRAARRAAQNPGEGARPQDVEAALRRRDERDSTRSHAPLVQAAAAVRLDTSDLTLAQVVDRIVALLPGQESHA